MFQTQYEPNIGKVNYVKVITGELTSNSTLVNSRTGAEEHVNSLFTLDGDKRNTVQKLIAGDIGAIIKLKDVETNDTLHDKANDITIVPMKFPEPKLENSDKGFFILLQFFYNILPLCFGMPLHIFTKP